MRLLRAERRAFPGPARFLADDGRRAEVAEYLADLTRPFGTEPNAEPTGQSYGEMAGALLATLVPGTEPVDLLVLAFAVHDLWPGRATATYLSHRCPGTPLSFAICDQGSAAPFTALRVIHDHQPHRAVLLVVEQADLPYATPLAPPREHRAVAMMFGTGTGEDTAVRQHPDVSPADVPGLAASTLAELSTGDPATRLVLGAALADGWPDHPAHAEVPTGQPTTGVWWPLAEPGAGPVLLGDYDRELRYLCFAGIGKPKEQP